MAQVKEEKKKERSTLEMTWGISCPLNRNPNFSFSSMKSGIGHDREWRKRNEMTNDSTVHTGTGVNRFREKD